MDYQHTWGLESRFLMSKSEKNALFSKPFNGPILIFWNLILYTFLCAKIKKFTMEHFFCLMHVMVFNLDNKWDNLAGQRYDSISGSKYLTSITSTRGLPEMKISSVHQQVFSRHLCSRYRYWEKVVDLKKSSTLASNCRSDSRPGRCVPSEEDHEYCLVRSSIPLRTNQEL